MTINQSLNKLNFDTFNKNNPPELETAILNELSRQLMDAISDSNKIKIINLINKGADILHDINNINFTIDDDGKVYDYDDQTLSVLNFAINTSTPDLVEFLILESIKKNKKFEFHSSTKNRIISDIAHYENLDIIPVLAQQNFFTNNDIYKLLENLIRNGKPNAIDFLTQNEDIEKIFLSQPFVSFNNLFRTLYTPKQYQKDIFSFSDHYHEKHSLKIFQSISQSEKIKEYFHYHIDYYIKELHGLSSVISPVFALLLQENFNVDLNEEFIVHLGKEDSFAQFSIYSKIKEKLNSEQIVQFDQLILEKSLEKNNKTKRITI